MESDMSDVLAFTSENEYRSYRADLDFWWPNIVVGQS